MSLSTTLRIAFDARRVQRGLAGIKSGFQGIVKAGAGIAKIGVAFLALTAAAGAVVLKINSIGEEANASDARLQNIVKSMGLFGEASGEVSERLLDLADAQGRQMGIDDDVIALTQSKLLTFKELAQTANVMGGAFDRATAAALDMAAAGFGTAEGNAVQLGKALNDPIKGINSLTKSGITFTAAEKDVIKALVETGHAAKAQDLVLKAIETQVKGTAAATATSSSKIKVSMSQLVEAFAKPFSAGFDQLPGKLEGVFEKVKAKMTEAGAMMGTAISEGVNGDMTRLVMIGNLIGDAIMTGIEIAMKGASEKIGDWLGDKAKYVNVPLMLVEKGKESIKSSNPKLGQAMDEAERRAEEKESAERIKQRADIFNQKISALRDQYNEAVNKPSTSPSTILPPGWERTDGVTTSRMNKDDATLKTLKVIAENTAGGAKM